MAILHITFSLATQGSMKLAIRQHRLQRNESVLSVHDDLSIGPLQNFDERKTWLATHILDEDDQQLYDDMYENWKKKIANLPCDVDVWIWYSHNTHEQIGLRYVMSELIHKCSMVYGIEATEAMKSIQPNMDIRHTGELSSEMLMKLRPSAKRFSVQECQQLAKEWAHIIEQPGTLRLWKNERLHHVEEDAMDAYIIASAKNLHIQHNEEWLMPTHILAQTFETFVHYVGNDFVEYRLLTLVEQGVFAMKGDTSDIFSYQVKLL